MTHGRSGEIGGHADARSQQRFEFLCARQSLRKQNPVGQQNRVAGGAQVKGPMRICLQPNLRSPPQAAECAGQTAFEFFRIEAGAWRKS
ncbi:MAG: hypothetical protein B7X36_07710 [Thiomonas sp. 14-64-326]|nr:MAG: hypothetical protein B7X36_07710 [Thiomonas sp. 14-64-326]